MGTDSGKKRPNCIEVRIGVYALVFWLCAPEKKCRYDTNGLVTSQRMGWRAVGVRESSSATRQVSRPDVSPTHSLRFSTSNSRNSSYDETPFNALTKSPVVSKYVRNSATSSPIGLTEVTLSP